MAFVREGGKGASGTGGIRGGGAIPTVRWIAHRREKGERRRRGEGGDWGWAPAGGGRAEARGREGGFRGLCGDVPEARGAHVHRQLPDVRVWGRGRGTGKGGTLPGGPLGAPNPRGSGPTLHPVGASWLGVRDIAG